MRIAFTLAGLLVVLFIIMKLASRQAAELAPAAGNASAPSRAQAVAGQIQQAVQAGADARASQAEGQ